MMFSGHANTGWLSDVVLYFGLPLFPALSTSVYSSIASMPPNVIPPGLGFIPGSNSWDADFTVNADASGPYKQLYHGKLTYTKKILWFIPVTTILTQSSMGRSGAYPWETFPGGFYSFPVDLNNLSTNSIWYNANGSLSLANRFCFIPTASALDIGHGAVTLAKNKFTKRYSGAQPPNGTYSSSFDYFITEYSNSDINLNNSLHTSINERNGAWAGNQMAGVNNPPCASPCLDNDGISGPGNICQGSSATYNASVATSNTTLTWSISPSSGIASISASGNNCTVYGNGGSTGTVTLIAKVTNSCTNSVSIYSKAISVAPNVTQPTITFVKNSYDCFYRAKVSPYNPGFNYLWTAHCWTTSLPSSSTGWVYNQIGGEYFGHFPAYSIRRVYRYRL